MNSHEFNLDISKEPVSLNHLTIGQGDKNGTTVEAKIYDNGTSLSLAGYSVYFNMLLPDGKTMYRKVGTKSGNVATFVIDESTAGAVPGVTNDAYVTIEQSGSVIASTERISVRILKSVKNAKPAESWSSDIDEFEEQMTQAISSLNETNAAAQKAEAARASAETARVTSEQARASAETARANAESSRANAENSRVSAESSRRSAETARASAESSRASEFATLKQNAITATGDANDAAERANAAAGLAEEAREALADQASYYTYETVGDDELLTLVTID